MKHIIIINFSSILNFYSNFKSIIIMKFLIFIKLKKLEIKNIYIKLN